MTLSARTLDAGIRVPQEDGWKNAWISASLPGKRSTLQFIALTDSAVNNQGMLIDDIAITAIGYQADFESDNGGWDARGWSVVQNKLPQTFEVSVIHNGFPKG